ncbi:MAG: tRNA pseudouridine(38-40) synthase TruA, partial [Lachnospiraceae bacterium]|nr:tRNA pseudouridine(38-40) synthase TruA [Lachnospiraceae bacterium]
TILEVGIGAMNPEEIKTILAAKDRWKAGPMAPAKGLTLVRVEYEGGR